MATQARLITSAVSALVMLCAVDSAFARHIQVDRRIAIDAAIQAGGPSPQQQLATVFQEQGQVWTAIKLVPPAADSIRSIFIPFKINIGDGAQWYWACMSENGVLWLETAVSVQSCPLTLSVAATSPQRRNFIAADFSDLRYAADEPTDLYGTALFSAGIYDRLPPYRIEDGREAAIFTWYTLPYVAGAAGTFTGQAIVTNRGAGNFDLEFTWFDTPVTRGLHGFNLGPSRYTVPSANASTQDRFCFRDGRALSVCPPNANDP